MKETFARLKDKIESLEARHFNVVSLFLASFTLMFGKYDTSLKRLISAIGDFCVSIAYWFIYVSEDLIASIFGQVPKISPTVDKIQNVDVQKVLPFDLAVLVDKLENFGPALLDSENFLRYNIELLDFLYWVTFYASTLFPMAFMIFLVIKEFMLSENGRECGEITKPLSVFDSLLRSLRPVWDTVKSFVLFVAKKRTVWIFLLVIWLVNLNVVTVGVELLAFYYYFISSFDFFCLSLQPLRLGIDVIIMLFSGSVFLWLVVSFVIFNAWRKRAGYKNLEHNEAKNCGFAKLLNICSLVVGPMGLGKTSFVTDVIMSFVNIFKKKSHDIIYKHDLIFPRFSWELYERDLREKIEKGYIFGLAGIDLYVDVLKSVFDNTPAACYLYGYDYETYGLKKNVGHKMVTLFDVMKTYGRAYFVYLNENPAAGNYPIRFDGKFSKTEFFPRWSGDFFRTKPEERESRFSHILDQDAFRLGKPIEENNPRAGTFSWGLYHVMEFGKSQKNDLEIQGTDKEADESNQRNDLYEYALFVARHANVMVDNFVFFRFIADDQRPMAIPKKLRDCFSIVTILDKTELKLAMPCFGLEEWAYNRIYEPFKKFYYQFREKRGDKTLFIMLLKLIVGGMSNYYSKIYNIFGYFEMDIALEAGTAYGDGTPGERGAAIHKWYLSVKKVYGDRYATDALSDFFSKKQLEYGLGINQWETYGGLNMTTEEMQKQHERYILDLMKVMTGELNSNVNVQFDETAPARRAKNRKQNRSEHNFEWDVL